MSHQRKGQAHGQDPTPATGFSHGLSLGKSVGAYHLSRGETMELNRRNILNELNNGGRDVDNIDNFIHGFIIGYYVGLDYGYNDVGYDVYEQYAENYYAMLEQYNM